MSQKPPTEQQKSSPEKRLIRRTDLREYIHVADPQIAPDGKQILFERKHLGEKNRQVTNLWLWDSGSGDCRQFTSGEKDSHPRWSPSGREVAFVSSRKEGQPQIYRVLLEGGEATPLTRFPEGKIETFRWSPDGTLLAVMFRETAKEWTTQAQEQRNRTGESEPPRVIEDLYYRLDGDGYFDAQRFDLYIVDVETGEHRPIFDRDRLGWFSFDWSPDSSELVVAANLSEEPLIEHWQYELCRVSVSTGELQVLSGLPVGAKSAVAWSPDSQQIAFACREGFEFWGVMNTRLFVCTPEGENLRELTQGHDYCLAAVTLSDSAEVDFSVRLRWMPNSEEVLMNFGWQGQTHVYAASLSGDFHQRTTGVGTCILGSLSADGSRWGMIISDQLTLPEIALGEVQQGQREVVPQKATDFNGELLDSLELSGAECFWVDSDEGNRVQVWVMRPPGNGEQQIRPAVLEIHGGPHTQYGETYFHEFQVLAAEGYTVVYSNPRGSKGYGESHTRAIQGAWGGADWRDIQAVRDFMQQDPLIDSNRMGVMGGSYGGYMTNWVIGHTNDFAAAITDRCVSNLVSKAGNGDLPLIPGNYWNAHPWEDIEQIWAQSPIRYFGNVKTPTLVIHSEGDLRCNIEQGEQVFAALKKLGIPTRFVRYPRSTSHGMSRSGPADLRIHRLGQILDWWEQWLKP